MFGRRKIGIIIETFHSAGIYQHKVYDIGADPRDRQGTTLREEVVESLKRANELAWEQMPQRAGPIISRIEYKLPR